MKIDSVNIPSDKKYKRLYLYYSLYKGGLLFFTIAVVSYIITVVFAAHLGHWKSLFTLSFQTNILCTAFIYIVTVSILALVRYTQSTLWSPKYPSSGTEIINVITNIDSFVITIFYAIAGFVIVRSYFSILHNESYTTNWYIYPPGHRGHSKELNEENLFISWYGIVIGTWFSINRILEDKNVLEISSIKQPIISSIKVCMPTLIHRSRLRAFRVWKYSYFTFIFFNSILYYFVAQFFALWTTKLLATPVIGFKWYDIYLFLRVWLSGIYATLGFELCDRLFEICFGVVPDISTRVEETLQFDCLLDGLLQQQKGNEEHENGYIRSLAFTELAYLSRKQPSRRIQLFNHTNQDFSQSAWKSLSTECINTLNQLRKRLSDEYPKPSNSTGQQKKQEPYIKYSYSSSTSTSSIIEHDAFINRVKLINQNVLRDEYDTENEDMRYYLRNGLDDRTTGLFISYSTPNENNPVDIYNQNSNNNNDYDNKTSAQKTTYNIIQKVLNLKTKFKKWKYVKQFFIITREQQIRTLFYDLPDIINAVQVLGSLTASSFNEDPYGYVHRDLDIVLNSLLGTLTDVNQFIREPPLYYQSLPSIVHNEGAILDETEAITKALQDSIYTITLTFKDHLHQIKVDKKYEPFLKQLS
ncbi:unnamed protein product [Cunninghamella blakesleeana]